MQNITRSKARSGQPPDQVASPGKDSKNFPKTLNGPWQGKAIVISSAEVRIPSI